MPGTKELLRSNRPDGGIIKLLAALPASHTDASMLTNAVTVRTDVLAVFYGAERQKPPFWRWKNL